jgi:DNA-binding IclR family transcriptional regulator
MPEYIFHKRIESLINCINYEATGNAKQLADKMGISRSTLFNYLSFLRENGYVISYSRIKRTFLFEELPKLNAV